jgi:hypothetical protein
VCLKSFFQIFGIEGNYGGLIQGNLLVPN